MTSQPRSRPRRPAASPGSGFFEQVYELVRDIPPGRVATYGQVAALAGVPRGARAVGWALRALDGELASRVPWQRVVGQGGRISTRAGAGQFEQRRRLRAEGVRFSKNRIDMQRYGLLPRAQSRSTRPKRSRARRSR